MARNALASAHEGRFVKSGLAEWRREGAGRAGRPARGFRDHLGQAYARMETYVIAAAYTALVFLVRLLVLTLTLPLFLMAAWIGLVDGLSRRDLRTFSAGRESGYLYHRAKASLPPLLTLPWALYLAWPVSLHPLCILLPAALLIGLAVDLMAGSFKKYV
jgi:integrating conjugative element membrane protein (TIGR03747 family)